MTYRIVPRTDIGLDPVVRSSSGTPRPRLIFAQYLTPHYTGVRRSYSDVDTAATILAIDSAARARPQPAPNEYNYVIHQRADELVHEYAGGYVAAHSEGENPIAVGVLFLNGVDEPLTDAQVDKFRWLRDRLLVPANVLRPAHLLVPHREMPGAATACPGPHVLARRLELGAPWTPPTPPPPIGDHDVTTYIAQPAWAGANPKLPHLVVSANAVRPAVNADAERYPVEQIADPAQYEQLRTWGAVALPAGVTA